MQQSEGRGMRRRWMVSVAVMLCAFLTAKAEEQPDIKVVPEIRADKADGLYIGNRPPLAPSPLMQLPIGSIRPRGWLRHQLELEARGMTGHLEEISPWCKFQKNEWSDPKEKGQNGWEELPYWLKGYGDLGYVLHDENIIKEARRWIDAVLANQQADGWLGPRTLRTSLDGKPDLWPNMLILNVLQSYYDYSHDARVLDAMERYFRWELRVPDADFLVGYWPKMRAGDNLESVYWLYNRRPRRWLLDLAHNIHKASADWTSGVINRHGVNIGQGFREPGEYFIQAHDRRFLQAAERNYETVRHDFGPFPGGGYAADENCRPGYSDPHQGCETCTWVELMHSFEMLGKISGDGRWADRCEDVAFNSFPASMTADEKALHYLTGANMVQLDRKNHAPGIENGGTMLSFSPFGVYRCCQHNVSQGWPYYAEELWHATSDNGLCASLYAASDVKAKVGDGTTVQVSEDTDYPFDDVIHLKLSSPKPIRFPLYFRVPTWCQRPTVAINGSAEPVQAGPRTYIMVTRTWKDGDTVDVRFPMQVRVKTWPKDGNAVSISYGPLTFSLKIGEKYVRYGGQGDWLEQEVYPTTPWNYGLVLGRQHPERSVQVVRVHSRPAAQPFTADGTPLELHVKAKKIPPWTLDRSGLVGKLQPSPVRSDEPVETVTLIPMGAARLRISVFPVIGNGPDAHVWKSVVRPRGVKASASHVWPADTVDALDDGELPQNSGDQTIPRFTWWDHRGTTEWVQYDFDQPRRVTGSEVYWFDDTGAGSCRVPASWRLLYRDGAIWKPVPNASRYGVARDGFNKVTFTPVTTTGLRLEVKLQPNYSGGILEWRVKP